VKLVERIAAARRPAEIKQYADPPFWSLDSSRYPWWPASTPENERLEADFEGYVNSAYKADAIVFAAIDRRQQVFSQARFAWREVVDGRPGELSGGAELGLLEHPWPNGTTGELLARCEVDASLAGNCYLTMVDANGRIGKPRSAGRPTGRRIVRLRPDWVTLVIEAPSGNYYGPDAYVSGYLYQPSGVSVGEAGAVLLTPDEVAHYSPLPDPVARFRGMSWLTPVVREVEADKAATAHKLGFFQRGATPAMVVKGIQAATEEEFYRIVDMMEARHAGSDNSYRTLYLAAGADATVAGADLRQLDFKATQGAGEVRIAIASGVPAVILGISEGLAGSSLNAGNFSAARRLFVDSTMRDLWAKVCASLQVLVTPPKPNLSLWYDASDIPFLREDAIDAAQIRATEAQALRTLTDAGWEPDAAIEFVRTGDIARLLKKHTGLFSVQLQPPMTTRQPAQPPRQPSADAPPVDNTTNGRVPATANN